jgi:hypothetical protein
MVVDWTLPAGEHAGPIGMAGATVIWVLLSAILVHRHITKLGREA